ncbi:MAG: hypothetical protein QXF12_06145 [Candidatus Aenigmatarchaeota archaeon]
MKKVEYLKKCILHEEVLKDREWYVRTMSIVLNEDEIRDDNILFPLFKNKKCYFLDVDKKVYEIEDYEYLKLLFSPKDEILIDSTWNLNVDKETPTTFGRLIFNAFVLRDLIKKSRIGYINEKVSISKLEDMFFNLVKNDDEYDPTKNHIRVSEMVECIDRLYFISSIAPLINIAATRKCITKAPNIDEIRKKLLDEYKDKLDNPVYQVEFEKKLEKIDEEYLKDDPAAKNVFSKKSRNARKKLYLSFGTALDFKQKSNPDFIASPLSEGVKIDKDTFPKYMNDLRVGSYSRGSFTALSGYAYKILQRSLSNIIIDPVECDTTRGIKRLIDASNYKQLTGRSILINGEFKVIDNTKEASEYIGKIVEVRSPMYCTKEKNKICYKCLNVMYKNIPDGVTNIASELSSVLMNLFLKLMHSTTTESTVIEEDDFIT